jgi:cation:H+ antiporter
LYSFAIPLKGTISLLDMLVLVGCFVAYMWRVAQAEVHEPDLVGPAAVLALLPPMWRRAVVGLFFLYAAGCIIASAEPFAEALIATGRHAGIDEFLLVQWLAPLASEAPEVVIACILTLKGDAQAGMGAMISSKVNQWTLLVGTLPLVYSVSLGHPGALHLDPRQTEEILLTAAQSAFAVAVLANLRLSMFEVAALFTLFVTQLFVPDPTIRYVFSGVYVVLALATFLRQRAVLPALFRAGLIPGRSHGS